MDYHCLLHGPPHRNSENEATGRGPAALLRRTRLPIALLAGLAMAGAPLHASGVSGDVTVEPRIVEARLRRISLRAGRRVAAGGAARLASGDHPLDCLHRRLRRPGAGLDRAGRGRLAAAPRPRAGDSAAAAGPHPRPRRRRRQQCRSIVRKGAVTVRASVEVAIATPWLGRLMLMGATRTLVRDVALELPISPDRELSVRWPASAPISPTPPSAAPRRGWRPGSIGCRRGVRWSPATAHRSPP